MVSRKSAKFILAGIYLLSSGLFATPALAQEATKVARPPQYVLMSFDGSLSLNMWNETLNFSRDNNLKFTYFISGVYFLLNGEKRNYVEPSRGAGVSAIGWGGSSVDAMKQRVAYVNKAHETGNEIGSHANGHFDGSKYSYAQWSSEFKQFFYLIFNVFSLNKIDQRPVNPFNFKPSQVVGFRAPQLGKNDAMYKVLKENNFTYDASKSDAMDYWPQKVNGIWNFPLARVRIAGTGVKTLSMDYNFYFSHSKAQDDSRNYAKYKKQMLDTYLGYFSTNYYGNRAPVHIGHHFSKWNGGAYHDALMEFAKTVCAQPEVKCVTYSEYRNFLEEQPAATLAAYQKGEFSKLSPTPSASQKMAAVKPLNEKLLIASKDVNFLTAMVYPGAGSKSSVGAKTFVWKVDDVEIYRSSRPEISFSAVASKVSENSTLSVSVYQNGQELLRTTHLVKDVNGNSFGIAEESFEDHSLKGDMPEAHMEEASE